MTSPGETVSRSGRNRGAGVGTEMLVERSRQRRGIRFAFVLPDELAPGVDEIDRRRLGDGKHARPAALVVLGELHRRADASRGSLLSNSRRELSNAPAGRTTITISAELLRPGSARHSAHPAASAERQSAKYTSVFREKGCLPGMSAWTLIWPAIASRKGAVSATSGRQIGRVRGPHHDGRSSANSGSGTWQVVPAAMLASCPLGAIRVPSIRRQISTDRVTPAGLGRMKRCSSVKDLLRT